MAPVAAPFSTSSRSSPYGYAGIMTWRGLEVVEESGPSVDELRLLRRSASKLCRSLSTTTLTLKSAFNVSMTGASRMSSKDSILLVAVENKCCLFRLQG